MPEVGSLRGSEVEILAIDGVDVVVPLVVVVVFRVVVSSVGDGFEPKVEVSGVGIL